MRTLIITIISAFIINSLLAQDNDFAVLDTYLMTSKTVNSEISKKESNSVYLKSNENRNFSNTINNWKDKIANYDLKNTAIYDDSEKATYRLSFKNSQTDIIVDYDTNGNIISTYETYKNIKIPSVLRRKIFKLYPKCSFIQSAYNQNYSNNKGIILENYKVVILNNNRKKELKFNKHFEQI